MAQNTCPKCGKQLPEDAKFCSYCGCTISTESSAPEKVEDNTEVKQEEVRVKDIWVCPDCGFEMTEEEESCPNCACPKSLFEHKQVNERISLKTETDDVKAKTPKWITFLVLALVAFAGITIANGVIQDKKYEAAQEAQEAAREAEYQRRVEEEQRQKKLKEERIRDLRHIIAGNSYSRRTTAIYSDYMKDLVVFSFYGNGKGTLMIYLAGFNSKSVTEVSWWINDDEKLAVRSSDGTDYFRIHPGYIEATLGGDKFYKEY